MRFFLILQKSSLVTIRFLPSVRSNALVVMWSYLRAMCFSNQLAFLWVTLCSFWLLTFWYPIWPTNALVLYKVFIFFSVSWFFQVIVYCYEYSLALLFDLSSINLNFFDILRFKTQFFRLLVHFLNFSSIFGGLTSKKPPIGGFFYILQPSTDNFSQLPFWFSIPWSQL